MHIRIYQINMKRDTSKVAFMGSELLSSHNLAIEPKIYDKVYEGNVDCGDLEDLYTLFKTNRPKEYKGRAIAVSDIVEVISENGQSDCFFCDCIGFNKIASEQRNALINYNKLSKYLNKAHFDEFVSNYSVQHLFGNPTEWDMNDDNLVCLAKMCQLWYTDNTVILAREIAAYMPIEYQKDMPGIEAHHIYNNVISELPNWDKFDSPEILLHYARKIVEEYKDEYSESKNLDSMTIDEIEEYCVNELNMDKEEAAESSKKIWSERKEHFYYKEVTTAKQLNKIINSTLKCEAVMNNGKIIVRVPLENAHDLNKLLSDNKSARL